MYFFNNRADCFAVLAGRTRGKHGVRFVIKPAAGAVRAARQFDWPRPLSTRDLVV